MSEQKHRKSQRTTDEAKGSHSKSHRSKSSKPEEQQEATSEKPRTSQTPVQLANPHVVLCENCQKQAHTFCATCDSIYCSDCFDQIHANPALKHHIKQSPSLLQLFTKQCNYHLGQRCRLVCLTCNVFICSQCKTSSHIGHNIMQVQDAFSQEIMKLQQQLSQINAMQAQISQEVLKYEQIECQINTNEAKIRQKLNMQVEELLNSLKIDKTQKLMQIQPDKLKMQSKLNYINWAVQAINKLSCGQLDEINLLIDEPKQLNPIFQEHISTNIQLPTAKSNIFTILHQIEQQLADFQTYRIPPTPSFDVNLRDVSINTISSSSLEAKELLINKLTGQLNQQEQNYQTELAKWMELTENYAQTLNNHQLLCAFCGTKISQKAANSICTCNAFVEKDSVEAVRRAERVVERDGDVSVEQAVEVIGTGRHYWVDTSTK